MHPLTLPELARILGAELRPASASSPETPAGEERSVSRVSIHSGRVQPDSVFFALRGAREDGHRFVWEALLNGAAAAVVAHGFRDQGLPDAPLGSWLLFVADPLAALQRLAGWWRRQLAGTVVAITGSTGKTIVKDALFHILSHSLRPAAGIAPSGACSASPGSYNSQLGVPLSLLRASDEARVVLLEAGISAPGEMDRLRELIRPQCGVLTNVGWAHVASFGDRATIAAEKAHLFREIGPDGWILVPAGDPFLEPALRDLRCRVLRFSLGTLLPEGTGASASEELPCLVEWKSLRGGILLRIRFPSGEEYEIASGATSPELAADLFLALCAATLLGAVPEEACRCLAGYSPVSTRSETWKSPAGVTLIHDAPGAEPLSVRAALRSLEAASTVGGRRFFVFGGMEASGASEPGEYEQAGELAAEYQVDVLLLLGDGPLLRTAERFSQCAAAPATPEVIHCAAVADVRRHLLSVLRPGDTVLVKAPRAAGIDLLARELVEAMAPNRFYVDLGAIAENVSRLRTRLGAGTRLLAMVKALAYGTDSVRLSLELQRLGVDAIGVSTADEGRALLRAGVDLPILVMMCTPDEVDKLFLGPSGASAAESAEVDGQHPSTGAAQLIPVIYSLAMIEALSAAARARGVSLDVHLEVDTGMGRLGVAAAAVSGAAAALRNSGVLRLCGVMTHFAGADSPADDEFTLRQIRTFHQAVAELEQAGFLSLIRHAAATAGAIRFPDAMFDMVRIGLGLYGLAPSAAVRSELELTPAVALVSRIVSVAEHSFGDRIGYGGTFAAPHDGFRAAILPLGYHDGVPWSLANRCALLVNGQPAPVCGRISMDSLVIDITGIPDAGVGTDVLVFGRHGGYLLPPEEIAAAAGTIVYELLARLGPRVQRIFIGG